MAEGVFQHSSFLLLLCLLPRYFSIHHQIYGRCPYIPVVGAREVSDVNKFELMSLVLVRSMWLFSVLDVMVSHFS